MLLDTVGGDLARWALTGGGMVTLALLAVITAKLLAVWLGIATLLVGGWPARLLAWAPAVVPAGYGGVEAVAANLM